MLWNGSAKIRFALGFYRLQKQAVRVILNLNLRESCRGILLWRLFTCLRLLRSADQKCAMLCGRDIHRCATRGSIGIARRTSGYKLPFRAAVELVNKLHETDQTDK